MTVSACMAAPPPTSNGPCQSSITERPPQPTYVQCCGQVTIGLKSLDGSGRRRLGRGGCASGRCPNCRPALVLEDRDRIRGAVARFPGFYCAAFFTMAPKTSGSVLEAYDDLPSSWDRLRKRIGRRWGSSKYVTVLEQQGSWMPHLNVLLRNEALFTLCGTPDGQKACERELRDQASQVGFGYRAEIGRVRNMERLIQYYLKKWNEQVPVDAPHQTPFIRSSPHFLAPRARINPYASGKVLTKEEAATWERPCQAPQASVNREGATA